MELILDFTSPHDIELVSVYIWPVMTMLSTTLFAPCQLFADMATVPDFKLGDAFHFLLSGKRYPCQPLVVTFLSLGGCAYRIP
jgi:hypothetical protein